MKKKSIQTDLTINPNHIKYFTIINRKILILNKCPRKKYKTEQTFD